MLAGDSFCKFSDDLQSCKSRIAAGFSMSRCSVDDDLAGRNGCVDP